MVMEMTKSRAGRRREYFALLSIAVAIGFGLVIWPADDGFESLDEAVAERAADPDPAVAELTTPIVEGENEAADAPQREALDEASMDGIADPLWIQVNDASGAPAQRRTVAITSVGELPIWLVETIHTTDRDGRVAFDREQLLRIAEESGWEKVIVGVWDWKARGFAVEQTVALSELDELTLTVPNAAAVYLELVDVPEGYGPQLTPDSESSSNALEGVCIDGNQWIFQPVPIGQKWRIELVRGELHPETGIMSPWFSSNLPSMRLVGPRVLGEVVRAEYELGKLKCATARIVDETGRAVAIPPDHLDALKVLGFGRSTHLVDEGLQVESLGNGNLMLVGTSQAGTFSQFGEIWIEWQPTLLGPGHLELAPDPCLQSARFGSADVLPEDGVIDLGDVVLAESQPLLDVIVRDGNGEAVEDVEVSVEVSAHSTDKFLASGPYMVDPVARMEIWTNDKGRAQFLGSDWESLFYFGLSTEEQAKVGVPEFLEVQVSAADMVPIKRRLPMHARSVELFLQQAGSVQGSIEFGDLPREGLLIFAFPAGGPYGEQDLLGRSRVGHRPSNFVISELPPGKVDLVLYWAWKTDWPIAKVYGVEVLPGKSVAPEVLQDMPLDSIANWINLDLSSTCEFAEYAEAMVLVQLEEGFGVTETTRTSDGKWKFPLPEGVEVWTGSVQVQGCGKAEAVALSPGDHSIALEPERAVELRVVRGTEGYGDRWDLWFDRRRAAKSGRVVAHLSNEEGMPILHVPHAGSFEIWWHWTKPDEKPGFAVVEIVITEADIARGYAEITPPDDF